MNIEKRLLGQGQEGKVFESISDKDTVWKIIRSDDYFGQRQFKHLIENGEKIKNIVNHLHNLDVNVPNIISIQLLKAKDIVGIRMQRMHIHNVSYLPHHYISKILEKLKILVSLPDEIWIKLWRDALLVSKHHLEIDFAVQAANISLATQSPTDINLQFYIFDCFLLREQAYTEEVVVEKLTNYFLQPVQELQYTGQAKNNTTKDILLEYEKTISKILLRTYDRYKNQERIKRFRAQNRG